MFTHGERTGVFRLGDDQLLTNAAGGIGLDNGDKDEMFYGVEAEVWF